MRRAWKGAFLGLLYAAPAWAGGLPEAYEDCVPQETAQVCGEVLARQCLDLALPTKALAGCRAALAEQIEADISRRIAGLDPGQRSGALELTGGAARHVAAFCAAVDDDIVPSRADGHAARCRLMAAHLKYYHLIRALAGGRET